MIHILYLASGSSRRFGSNKLLYELNGKPMFLYGLEMLRELVQKRDGCALTVISRYAQVRAAAGQMSVGSVDCPDSEKGISYTIREGILSLELERGDYLLFVVADQPYLGSGSVERLLELANGETVCASLCYGGVPGNPALFSASLVPELLALEGDQGGRAVLKRHPCIFVPADSEKELKDFDIPE